MRAGALERFVVEHAVSMRGWPVPYVDQRVPVQRHGTWVAQDTPRVGCRTVRPGACSPAASSCIDACWRQTSATPRTLKPDAAAATGAVAVWDVLLYMVEVAEFGARMATAL